MVLRIDRKQHPDASLVSNDVNEFFLCGSVVISVKIVDNLYHAVTDNFLHCEIVSEKLLEANQTVKILITEVLEQRIKKGGDIEVSAKFL